MTPTAETIERRLADLIAMLPVSRAMEVLDFAQFLATQEPARPEVDVSRHHQSFGIWRDRADLHGDSVELVNNLRGEWLNREDDRGVG